MVLRAQWRLGAIAQFSILWRRKKKRRQKKTKAFYDWATTGIPVKSNFILTFLLEGCLVYQIHQVQYLQSYKPGFWGWLQKWFANCKLLICWKNFPKLCCRYGSIIHNRLWNSENKPQWIQQKISRKVTETDSQKLLLNSKTVNNNYLREPCAYQRACEVKLPEPRLIAWSQLGHFLQNVKTTNFRD